MHGAVAWRAEGVAIGLAPKQRDELGQARDLEVRPSDQQQADAADHRHADEVGRHGRGRREHRRRDRQCRARGHQQLIAVGQRLRDHARAEQGAGAGPVLDDDRLAEAGTKVLGDEPAERVGQRARRIRHRDLDEAIGEGRLREADRRDRRETGGQCPQDPAPRPTRHAASGATSPRSNSRRGRSPGAAGATLWPSGSASTPTSGVYGPLTPITGSPATVTRFIVRRCG